MEFDRELKLACIFPQAWDVKGQSATLVRDIKVHKKAVTCFSLLEPQNCLLTGSADKTIRVCLTLTVSRCYLKTRKFDFYEIKVNYYPLPTDLANG